MTSASPKSNSYRRHQPFVIAFLAGAIGLGGALAFAPSEAIEFAAVLFFLTYLTLIAFRLSSLTAEPLARAELASVHAAMHRAESRHDVPVGTA